MGEFTADPTPDNSDNEIMLLRKIAKLLDDGAVGGSGAATIADGADATQGAKADAPVADNTTVASATAASGISLWKRMVNLLIAILAKLQIGATNQSIVRATSTGTAATLVIARATRKGLLVRNLDTANSVWVGGATVTSANGFLIKPGEALPITWVGLLQIIDNGSDHAAVAVLDEYY